MTSIIIVAYIGCASIVVSCWWKWPFVYAVVLGWIMLPVGLLVLFINKALKRKVTIAGVEVSFD